LALAAFILIPVAVVLSNLGTEADEIRVAAVSNATSLLSEAPFDHSDRSNFMGARACIDCHRSEYVSWLNTAHYNNRANRFEGKETSIDTKYRAITGNTDLCYTCHSLPHEERFGRRFVESGTSCESCHGAAGSETGWLNLHAVYGPNVTRMEHETLEHRSMRISRCEEAGMVRSERQYLIAKNCFSCHIVGDTNLIQAGHKSSFDSFSLIPYLLGEVRHNFHQDQRQNAKAPTLLTARQGVSPVLRVRMYFVVEQLARMHVALTNIGRLPSEDDLDGAVADSMLDIVDDAAGQLEEFAEVLLEEENTEGEVLTEDQVAALIAAVDIFTEFDDLDEQTRAAATIAAQQVDLLATEFEQLHDGEKLSVLDVEFLEDLGDPVGEALKP